MRMQKALAFHRQGHLKEAERLYQEVLAITPDQVDAMHFLGVLKAQNREFDSALALLNRVVELFPGNLGVQYNRANILRDMGRLQDALAGYDIAIAIKPDATAALNNKGTVLHTLKRYDEALTHYNHALRYQPDNADTFINRGNTLVELDRSEEAIEDYNRALALNSKLVAALYGRGNALAKLKRLNESANSYEHAIGLEPHNPQLRNNLGNVLGQLGRHDDAIQNFDRAIAVDPKSSEAYANRGNALIAVSKYEDALASFSRALELDPARGDALYGQASVLVELGRHDESISSFRRMLEIDPEYPYARGMLVYAQRTCCDWSDEAAVPKMIAAIREGKKAATPLVLLAVSDSSADKLRCAEILMRDKHPPSSTKLWQGEPYSHQRIRVAYLSADFRQHPVSMLMAGVFERHNKEKFQTFAVSHGPDDRSAMRARLAQAFDRFIDVRGKSDMEIATLIRELEVDILVDLTGLTAGARQGILALRPAPAQVNYLGYAASVGADHMDYMLADRNVISLQEQGIYRETIIFLPDCFMPFSASANIKAETSIRQKWELPERGFVFASFNNCYKFNPPMFDVWMRLLLKIKGSVLWLPASNEAAMRNLTREAERRSVEGARLIFAERVADHADHLARLRHADLFLDTLPYNAHATAMDALWSGLPVLTCEGQGFAGRVAASLLRAIGLPELIVETLPDYEQKALELANNPVSLAGLRERLLRNRLTHPLFDTELFTRHLEAAYSTMHQRTQHGEQPASFSVEPVKHPATI